MNFEEFDIAIPDDATEERKPYFDALRILKEEQDFKAALKAFKRASRKAEPPFDTLSTIAAGECEFRLGREGAALRTWKQIGQDESLADTLRYAAWLNIASLEEARDNQRGLEQAHQALEEIGDVAER